MGLVGRLARPRFELRLPELEVVDIDATVQAAGHHLDSGSHRSGWRAPGDRRFGPGAGGIVRVGPQRAGADDGSSSVEPLYLHREREGIGRGGDDATRALAV